MRIGRMQVGVKSFRREFVGVVDADGKVSVHASAAAALRAARQMSLDALAVFDGEGEAAGVLFLCAPEAVEALLEHGTLPQAAERT